VIVDANANALRLFAYDEGGILKQDYFALCGAVSKQILADKREWARIAAGDMRHTERSYSARDGREVWSSVNFAALKNDDGSTRRVLGMFTDMGRFAWKPNDARWAGY
jgi:PAS domain-containing protein